MIRQVRNVSKGFLKFISSHAFILVCAFLIAILMVILRAEYDSNESDNSPSPPRTLTNMPIFLRPPPTSRDYGQQFGVQVSLSHDLMAVGDSGGHVVLYRLPEMEPVEHPSFRFRHHSHKIIDFHVDGPEFIFRTPEGGRRQRLYLTEQSNNKVRVLTTDRPVHKRSRARRENTLKIHKNNVKLWEGQQLNVSEWLDQGSEDCEVSGCSQSKNVVLSQKLNETTWKTSVLTVDNSERFVRNVRHLSTTGKVQSVAWQQENSLLIVESLPWAMNWSGIVKVSVLT